MGMRKLFADQYLVIAARLQQPAVTQVDLVEKASTMIGQGKQVSTDRIVETCDIQVHVGDHPRLHLVDAGDFLDAFDQRQRGALE